DRTGASAPRLSIAAATVIAKPLIGKNLHFSTSADLCKEVSTKGKDSPAAEGRELAVRKFIFDQPEAGTRLFLGARLAGPGGERGRRDPALRAGVAAAKRMVPAVEGERDHAEVS